MKKKYKYPSVLSIAGFDGSGGAGIQADIKTISALGCYATSVLTALPIQNTTGVQKIYPIPNQAVQEQVQSIMDDIVPDAIKIGMVPTPEMVNTIVKTLHSYPKLPLVLDPVMVATSGHQLIEDSTVAVLIEKIFPLAILITPNLDEASLLAGMEINSVEEMQIAGSKIMLMGCRSLLLKGGHLDLPMLTSLYFDSNGGIHFFEYKKFETNNTHGSGCTLSSAIASYIAIGNNLYDSVSLGQKYVHQAIENGADVLVGKGNGPLNHFYNPKQSIKHEMV